MTLAKFQAVRGFGVYCKTIGAAHFVILTISDAQDTIELQIPAKDQASGILMATAIAEAVTKYADHVGGGRVQ